MSRSASHHSHGLFAPPPVPSDSTPQADDTPMLNWLQNNKTQQLLTNSCATACISHLAGFSIAGEEDDLSTQQQLRIIETAVYNQLIDDDNGCSNPGKLIHFLQTQMASELKVRVSESALDSDLSVTVSAMHTGLGIPIHELTPLDDHDVRLCITGESPFHVELIFREGDHLYLSDPASNDIKAYPLGDESIYRDAGFSGVALDVKLDQTKIAAFVHGELAHYKSDATDFSYGKHTELIAHENIEHLFPGFGNFISFCAEAEHIFPDTVIAMYEKMLDSKITGALEEYLAEHYTPGEDELCPILIEAIEENHLDLLKGHDFIALIEVAKNHYPDQVEMLLNQALSDDYFSDVISGASELTAFIDVCGGDHRNKIEQVLIKLTSLHSDEFLSVFPKLTQIEALANTLDERFDHVTKPIILRAFSNECFETMFTNEAHAARFVDRFAERFDGLEDAYAERTAGPTP